MSTSLLYHAWGLRGYRHVATDFAEGATVFRLRQNADTLCCGHCGGRNVMRQGVVVRRFKALPIGRKPVWLELPVQRLWCATCNKTRQVKLAFGQGSLAGLPPAGWLFVALALAAAIILARTPFGRRLYAIGHNEQAARFSGIAVGKIKLLLYTLSGLMAGVTAVILVAHRDTAKADLGSGMELDVITAVVLGGTSIFGGRGNIVGTVLGVLLIHETRELLSWRWNQDELTLVVIGALLIASVLLNRLCQGRRKAD